MDGFNTAYNNFLAYSPLAFASRQLEDAFLDSQLSGFYATTELFAYLNLFIHGRVAKYPHTFFMDSVHGGVTF
jgi:hypothetical protein